MCSKGAMKRAAMAKKIKRQTRVLLPSSAIVNFSMLVIIFFAFFWLEKTTDIFRVDNAIKMARPSATLIEERKEFFQVERAISNIPQIEPEEVSIGKTDVIDLEPKLAVQDVLELEASDDSKSREPPPKSKDVSTNSREDIQYPIENLDNEYTRQQYIAANANLARENGTFIPFERK